MTQVLIMTLNFIIWCNMLLLMLCIWIIQKKGVFKHTPVSSRRFVLRLILFTATLVLNVAVLCQPEALWEHGSTMACVILTASAVILPVAGFWLLMAGWPNQDLPKRKKQRPVKHKGENT